MFSVLYYLLNGRTPRRHYMLPMLFIGVGPDKRLVHVGDLEQGGKTDLRCPYCDDLLTAKKGDIVMHHFAHSVGSGCVKLKKRSPRLRLPLFDSCAGCFTVRWPWSALPRVNTSSALIRLGM